MQVWRATVLQTGQSDEQRTITGLAEDYAGLLNLSRTTTRLPRSELVHIVPSLKPRKCRRRLRDGLPRLDVAQSQNGKHAPVHIQNLPVYEIRRWRC
jgi:hypothetical protein